MRSKTLAAILPLIWGEMQLVEAEKLEYEHSHPKREAALKAEYELIQQKKSKLSATKRRQVVAAYERLIKQQEKCNE